jgi:predicted negative regulator of RcsB-dependent stress response
MIPLAVLTWFRTNPRNVWLIAGLLAVIAVLAFTYQRGRHDAAEKAAAARAVAIQEALKVDARAKEKAADERLRDAAKVAETKERLTDAVADVQDQVPDPVAVRLGCERLRQAGYDLSGVPACS